MVMILLLKRNEGWEFGGGGGGGGEVGKGGDIYTLPMPTDR